MKIMPPIAVTGDKLQSSSIAEPDASAGEVAWAASTAYAAGDVRIRTTTHRRYLALKAIANTVTTPPENDAANWTDVGPTNRFSMFDYSRNVASYVGGTTSITWTVAPGSYTPSVILTGVSAETVRVQATSSGAAVYDKTIALGTRNVANYYEYFFNEFTYRTTAFFFDLPLYKNAVITVTLGRATAGYLAVQHCTYGNPIQIGDAQFGANSDILDFSNVTRDAFGNATLIKRKNVPVLSVEVMATKASIPAIRSLRSTYAASPLVFLPVEDSSDDYAEALAMVGIYKRMSIAVEYPTMSLINIEAEGI